MENRRTYSFSLILLSFVFSLSLLSGFIFFPRGSQKNRVVLFNRLGEKDNFNYLSRLVRLKRLEVIERVLKEGGRKYKFIIDIPKEGRNR